MMSSDQLSKAFSDMYMKADKLEQGLISLFRFQKRNIQRLMHGEYGQIPDTSKYTKATASTSPRRITPSVIISAASKVALRPG